MKTESAQAAPLESFPNSPCHYYAQHIQPGVYVEVLNPDGQGNLKNDSNAYWFAEIKERYSAFKNNNRMFLADNKHKIMA